MTPTVMRRASAEAPAPATPPGRRWFGPDRTTPGVLGALLKLLVVLSLSVGALCALGMHSHSQTLGRLSTAGEVHQATDALHHSLIRAEVTGGAAFLAHQLRDRQRLRLEAQYEGSVSEAHSALATLVSAAGTETDADQRDLLGTLPGRLFKYLQLVDDALVFNRLDDPIASAYKLHAAHSMRTLLLPAAGKLHQSVGARLARDQAGAATLPVVELALCLLVLVVLIATQVYLSRRTRRVFNLGLGVATLAAVAMPLWITAAGLEATRAATQSRVDGSEVTTALSAARFAGLSARANEMLIAIAALDRRDSDRYEHAYQRLTRELTRSGGLLGTAEDAAGIAAVREQIDNGSSSARAWTQRHDQLLAAAGAGHRQAARLLVTTKADTDFGAFDQALGAAIDDSRLRFGTAAARAGAALTGLVVGIIGLAVLILAGSTIGIWQRLREFR